MIHKLLVLALLFISFRYQAQPAFQISGKLKGFKEHALVKIERQNLVLDSCYLHNGTFTLNGTLEEAPALVYLTIMNGDEFVYTSLFIGNESLSLKAKKEEFPYDVKVKGSETNRLNYEHSQLEKDWSMQRSELLEEMFTLKEAGKWNDSLQQAYWGAKEPLGKIRLIDIRLDQIRDEFIDKHFNSYFGLYMAEMYKTVIPESKLKNYLENLSPELKHSSYAKSIESHLKYPDLKAGATYYDFNAADQHGKQHQFSEFFSTKYVLLDFSTIYCGFCIRAIPDLEKIRKASNGSLEVVTFYVDKNPKGLEELSKRHSEDWMILWDKQGRLSETYAKYKVFGTPTFYLFDASGKLVEVFDGYSEDLQEQIEAAIKK